MAYKSNYLARVIIQLRFDPLLVLETEAPALYQKEIRQRFPALTEGQEVEIQTQLSAKPEVKTEVRRTRPRWVFSTDDRSSSLLISSKMFSLEYAKYKSIEAAKKDFEFLWGQFQKIYCVETLTRVGFRYIDQVNRKTGNFLDWKGWIADSLLAATFPMESPDGHELSRSMHGTHWTSGDHTVTFQFGIFNGEGFPGQVSKEQYVLDYDCASIGPVEATEVTDCLVKYHDVLSVLFEKSIGPDMKDAMNRGDADNKAKGEES